MEPQVHVKPVMANLQVTVLQSTSLNRHIKQATAQVSGFANAAVYKANNGYHREMTAAIQTLIEANEMDRIHVDNLA